MNIDEVIERCESAPVTEDRKMILALAREVQRLRDSGGQSSAKSGGKSSPGKAKRSSQEETESSGSQE